MAVNKYGWSRVTMDRTECNETAYALQISHLMIFTFDLKICNLFFMVCISVCLPSRPSWTDTHKYLTALVHRYLCANYFAKCANICFITSLYMNAIYMLSHASEAGSPTNRLGSGQR